MSGRKHVSGTSLAHRESEEQARLADAGVADQYQLEEVVAAGRAHAAR